jgi:hypothetical protein
MKCTRKSNSLSSPDVIMVRQNLGLKKHKIFIVTVRSIEFQTFCTTLTVFMQLKNKIILHLERRIIRLHFCKFLIMVHDIGNHLIQGICPLSGVKK